MSIVRSTWTASPINIAAPYNPAAWAGAGTMPLAVGSMLAKNDNQYLYVALDLPGNAAD